MNEALRTLTRRGAALAALTALLCAGFAPAVARADDEQAPPDQNPGVARISVLNGDGVVIKRGDSGDTVAAAINAPIMVGDYVSTDDGSKSEIQLDYGNLLRVGYDVDLRFVRLDPNNFVAQLAQGTVDVAVLRQTDGQPEIDTPSIAVRPSSVGVYRITVTSDGNTQVTVRSGSAQIVLPNGGETLTPGSTLFASGPASDPQLRTTPQIAYDGFDRWNDDRDNLIQQAFTSQYGNQFVGGADLYASGRWVNVPQYGEVWTPYETAGWAPYRAGSWVWQPYYGWTWVSTESWGWAPYHYGRWFYQNGYGWCWYPGARSAAPPVWQPALVAFVGFNIGSVGVGVGFGNIGWVPLAPREVYHPWWGPGYSNTRVTNITNITNVTNVTNVTDITTVYRNANVTGGVTAVTTAHFNRGVFTHPIVVEAADVQNAHAITSTLPIVPTTHNLQYTNKPIPAAAADRPPNPRLYSGFKVAPPPAQTFLQERQRVTSVTQKVYPNQTIPGATLLRPENPEGGQRPVTATSPRPYPEITPARPYPAITSSHPDMEPSPAPPVSSDPFSRFGTPKPQDTGLRTPQPTFHTPQPSFHTPQPSFHTPAPLVRTPAPLPAKPHPHHPPSPPPGK